MGTPSTVFEFNGAKPLKRLGAEFPTVVATSVKKPCEKSGEPAKIKTTNPFISTGLQPGDTGKRREANRFNGFPRQENKLLKQFADARPAASTGLKPGATEKERISEIRRYQVPQSTFHTVSEVWC